MQELPDFEVSRVSRGGYFEQYVADLKCGTVCSAEARSPVDFGVSLKVRNVNAIDGTNQTKHL